jgi:lipopolysaccharide export LptBFGC system permease protein LptF
MAPSKDPVGALLEAVARELQALAKQVEDQYESAFIETNKSGVLPFLAGAVLLAAIAMAYRRNRRGRRRDELDVARG